MTSIDVHDSGDAFAVVNVAADPVVEVIEVSDPGLGGGGGGLPPAPTGELGGTWAATIVDAVHGDTFSDPDGSHLAIYSGAVTDAGNLAGALDADHVAAADPHPQYDTPAGQSHVPTGGATGTVLTKTSAANGATAWQAPAGGGAPVGAPYLTTAADATLTNEVVVGTTPGGELGGTWAAPTVKPTHSGSAHLALGTTGATAAAGNHAHPGQVDMQAFIPAAPSGSGVSDTFTWTKPATALWVAIVCFGAGGGGGSGRKGAAASNRGGGGGGASGGMTRADFLAADLPATLNVRVGRGGLGGAAQATSSTDGVGGGHGGDTYVGASLATSLVAAPSNLGGVSAAGGGAGSTAGGGGGANFANGSNYGGEPGAGGSTGTGGNTPGSGGVLSRSGAGGGGLNTSNTPADGGVGGAPSSAPGHSNSAGGVNPGGTGQAGQTLGVRSTAGGGGGGGGASSATGNAGAGGAGASPGGGGAGGGAAQDGAGNSGKGGDGGGGIVLIVSFG